MTDRTFRIAMVCFAVIASIVLVTGVMRIIQATNSHDQYLNSIKGTCAIRTNYETSKIEVVSYDQTPVEQVEGYFSNRQEAEAYVKALGRCQ